MKQDQMDRLEKKLATLLQYESEDTPDFTKLKSLLLQRAAVENQSRAPQRVLLWFAATGLAGVLIALFLM